MGRVPARLAFGEESKAEGTWAGRRLLVLDDKPAFELSFWCGTCQFLFQRLEGANETLSMDEFQDQLNLGLEHIDEEVVRRFANLLAEGQYLVLLLTVEPRLITPSADGDYFAGEQLSTWGLDAFWGLPIYPRTPYYRTFDTAVDGGTHLYEFVVPMVPPSWNDLDRVIEYEQLLAGTSLPTAVAVSALDVCAPAVDSGSTDYHAHWGLTHFVLDGHHKLQAAAQSGRALRLLSLLTLDSSLAEEHQVLRVPEVRRQSPASRGTAA